MSKNHYTTIDDDVRRKTLRGDATGLCVYLEIKSRVGTHEEMWASASAIADSTGLGIATVKRAIKRLRASGLISTVRKTGRVMYTALSNRYHNDTADRYHDDTSQPNRYHNDTGIGINLIHHRYHNDTLSILKKNTNKENSFKGDEKKKSNPVNVVSETGKETPKGDTMDTNQVIDSYSYEPSDRLREWAGRTYPNLDVDDAVVGFRSFNAGKLTYGTWERMFTCWLKRRAVIANVAPVHRHVHSWYCRHSLQVLGIEQPQAADHMHALEVIATCLNNRMTDRAEILTKAMRECDDPLLHDMVDMIGLER